MSEYFPKWVYAADGASVLVKDRAAWQALDGDWRESPADFVVAEPEPEQVEAVNSWPDATAWPEAASVTVPRKRGRPRKSDE